jgi:hypothetical protein
LEEIPREEETTKLDKEIKKFQAAQKKLSKKVESLRADQAQKKKSLFSEMERKLKEELEKKTR